MNCARTLQFPINRHHQGLATRESGCSARSLRLGFQSIGVTKDWRLSKIWPRRQAFSGFPINRRHQGLATTVLISPQGLTAMKGFQSIGVTKDWRHFLKKWKHNLFIFRRFQSIGVTKDWRPEAPVHRASGRNGTGFQSIGVTKDWRQLLFLPTRSRVKPRFQSIGVTKDWRPVEEAARRAAADRLVSNQ